MNRAAIAKELRRTYLEMDPRTLALGRIFFALVLIGDLLRRIPWIREFYTNAGVLPNHTVLWRPPVTRLFSFFFMSSLPEEAVLWFAICFFCFFCFLIGWQTRLFHVLSFVMTTSLHNRMLFAENWGGVAIGALMVWTVFLPTRAPVLRRRACCASMRARRDETPEELAAGVPPPDNTPGASLAVLGLLLQIAIIYWFNYVHKSGRDVEGRDAVYYVLHQERIITWLGLRIREHIPYSLTKLMTYGTLVVEAAVPFLVLTPVFWRVDAPLALVLLVGLHGSIAAMVNLGIFSAAMIAFDPFLLDGAHWQLFGRLVPRSGRARIVFYDVDCGVCFFIARVLARLDVHRRLRWLSNRDRRRCACRPTSIAELLDRTILVVDPRRTRRAAGRAPARSRRSSRALPFGGLWVVAAAGARACSALGGRRLRRVRAQPDAGSRPGWGWRRAACPPARGAGRCRRCRSRAEPTPLRAWVRATAAGGRASWASRWCSSSWRPRRRWRTRRSRAALRFDHRPEWMVAAVMYPHIFEGWSLFSPEAPLSDETVVVDAVTRDGRHVDPYNEVGSRVCVAAGRAACRCASATTRSGATTRCASPTPPSTTRR